MPAEEALIWLETSSKNMAFKDYAISSPTQLWNVKIPQFSLCSKQPDSVALYHFYVDNLLIGGKNLGDIKYIKTQLFGKFEMKDLEALQYFLGNQGHQHYR